VVQETRLFDAARGVTLPMRSKEEAHDYRYFPEPDLVPLQIDPAWIDRVGESIPELPDARRRRFESQYGLPAYDADVLVASRALADYFEAAVGLFEQPKVVSNWMMGDLIRELNQARHRADEAPVTPQRLAELLRLIDQGTISGKIAKTVFEEMYRTGRRAADIVAERGLVQMSDSDALLEVINEILAAHPDQVAAYRGGKEKLLGFFVGQTMRATQGKANPGMVNTLLKQALQ
jgi:aspartyl-tRNA(Asn)/glutamyl-tRNA(Gln) amidotransferase subunit B